MQYQDKLDKVIYNIQDRPFGYQGGCRDILTQNNFYRFEGKRHVLTGKIAYLYTSHVSPYDTKIRMISLN